MVVIVAGAGDCADSWVPIRRQLGASHRVASYDRAGIGGSDACAAANIDRCLAELDAVIDAVSPRSPVTLVGHSLGGLIARFYQNANPGRVNSLVLLDSTPEGVAGDRGVRAGFAASSIAARLLKLLSPLGFVRLLLKAAKMPLYPEQRLYQAAVSPPQYQRWMTMVCASFSRGAGDELRSVLPAASQAAGRLAGHGIDIPLTVVASMAFGDKWISWQRQIAALSPKSSLTLTGTKAHNIHLRHPDLVANAVTDMSPS